MKYLLLIIALLLLPLVQAQENTSNHNCTLEGNNTFVLENTTLPKSTCNIDIYINPKKQLLKSGEKLEYYFHLTNNSEDFKINYWIEDLHGKIIRNKRETTNTNKKSFTPKIEKNLEVFIIKAELSTNCLNQGKNYSEEYLIIQNNVIKEPFLELKRIPEKITFGMSFDLQFEAYLTNTTKETINIKIFNESITLLDKNLELEASYTTTKLKLPFVTAPNCNQKFAESLYTLQVSGINLNHSSPLYIENTSKSLCLIQEISKILQESEENTTINLRSTPGESIIKSSTKPKEEQKNQEFKSSSSKTRDLTPYILGASILVLALFLFKGELKKHGTNNKSDHRSSRFPRGTHPENNRGHSHPYEGKRRSKNYQRTRRRRKTNSR